jgi:hypothetical protein
MLAAISAASLSAATTKYSLSRIYPSTTIKTAGTRNR